jgi:hypothetical protein
MPRTTWTQNNFNAGEWSPLTYGRSDVGKYTNALAICLNYVPTTQGGLTRRPGTKYVANTKSNGAVRLIPFEFSITQAYILEFGDAYIRFYTLGGQLLSGGSPYEIVSPYTASDLQDLSFTQSADVLYIAHRNYGPRLLSRLGPTNWTLTKLPFADGPYLPPNNTATTLAVSATTGTVTLTASSATGINNGAGFTSNDIGRYVRIFIGSTWGVAQISAITSTTVVSAIVLLPIGSTAATTVWRLGSWYGVEGSSTTARYPGAVTFNQDRLTFASTWAEPNRIDASNSGDYINFTPTALDGSVIDSNSLAFALNASKVNAINWLVSDEWGLLAGTASSEWVVAASTTQVALTPTNVNAKQITTYGSTNVPPVRIGKSTLFVQRTKRKLREMTYQFTLGTFQAPDISLVSEHLTKSGIKQMAVQLAPHATVWLVTNDGVLIGIIYDKDQDVVGWHRHQLGGFSNAAQTLPPVVESIGVIPNTNIDRDDLWMVVRRSINNSTVRTVELMQKFWEDGDTLPDAYFVDCGATYSIPGTFTRSGTTITCTISAHGFSTGQTKTFLFSDSTFNGTGTGASYVVTVINANTFTITVADAGATSGTVSLMTSSISGLTWLVGQTVSVLGDGSVHPNCLVSAGGVITLQRNVAKAQVGLGYNSTGKTMRIEAGGADGPAQGKLKRIHRSIFRFFQSVGLNVQATNGNSYPQPWRTSADLMDNPVALYTGDKRWSWDGTYELEGQVSWTQSDPLPSNVLMVSAQLDTQDG